MKSEIQYLESAYIYLKNHTTFEWIPIVVEISKS